MLNDDFSVCNTTAFQNIYILQAIAKLESNKALVLDNLCSEAIKYVYSNIIQVLCVVFNAFCKHSFVCDNLCIGKIVPVPKKSNVCGLFEDFRPLTSVSTLAKLF